MFHLRRVSHTLLPSCLVSCQVRFRMVSCHPGVAPTIVLGFLSGTFQDGFLPSWGSPTSSPTSSTFLHIDYGEPENDDEQMACLAHHR
jgi:hypothetical protein